MLGIPIFGGIVIVSVIVVSVIVGIIWMKSVGKPNFGTYEYLTSLMVGLMVSAIIMSIYYMKDFPNMIRTRTYGFLLMVYVFLLIVVFSITGIVALSIQSHGQLIWVIATIIWLLIILGGLIVKEQNKYSTSDPFNKWK